MKNRLSKQWFKHLETIHNTQAFRLPKLPQALVCAILSYRPLRRRAMRRCQRPRYSEGRWLIRWCPIDTLAVLRIPRTSLFLGRIHGWPTETPETPGMPGYPGQGYSRACPSPPPQGCHRPGAAAAVAGPVCTLGTGHWAAATSPGNRPPAGTRSAPGSRG